MKILNIALASLTMLAFSFGAFSHGLTKEQHAQIKNECSKVKNKKEHHKCKHDLKMKMKEENKKKMKEMKK